MTSRLQEFLGHLPTVTLGLLFINIGVHAFIFLTSWPVNDFSFIPFLILKEGQYYRIVTSAFVHGGMFHIAMNMMSLVALGGALEPAYGSIRFLWISLLAIFLAGGIAFAFLYLCSVLINPSYLFTNSVGYSGVLFSYAVIEAFHSAEASRSVFGIFSVPTKWYPFILLLILQFILPNISFSGHLGGLLAGMLLISGIGNDLLLPSPERFERIEGCLIPGAVRRLTSYRPITTRELVHPYFEARGPGRIACNALAVGWSLLLTGLTCAWNLLATGLAVIGLPTDACHRSYSSCTASISSCWQRLLQQGQGQQGYEPLAQESTHSPLALEEGTATNTLVDGEGEGEGRDAAVQEAVSSSVVSAREMSALAALSRFQAQAQQGSATIRPHSRSNSRTSSPQASAATAAAPVKAKPKDAEEVKGAGKAVPTGRALEV